jgi:hypothetical protein
MRSLISRFHTTIRVIEAHVALRPIGLTLIIPLRNSTNVPLVDSIRVDIRHGGVNMPLYGDVQVSHVVEDEVD